MTDEELELQQVEQSFFEEIMSVILFLNKNGIKLDAVREMIEIKVERAFQQYPKLSDAYDKDLKK